MQLYERGTRENRAERIARFHGARDDYLAHIISVLSHATGDTDADRVARLLVKNQPQWFHAR